MTFEKCLKVVMCAEFQGKDAVQGSTSGFQRIVTEWINQSGIDNGVEVVVYCMGTENNKYKVFPNVTFKQYKPNLSLRDVFSLIPATIAPFLTDLFPVHPNMIQDIIKDNPDVIHTFQTFGVTDCSGYVAAKILKSQGKKVRFINTVMGEIDTYFSNYVQQMVAYFYKLMDSKSLVRLIKDSAIVDTSAVRDGKKVSLEKLLLSTPVVTSCYVILKSFELAGNIQDFLVSKGKVFLEKLLKQRYDTVENKIRQQMNRLRKTSHNFEDKESKYGLGYLAKPIQLIYDFVRRGDNQGPRVGLIGIFANSFRWFLEKQIPAYINNCDDVTISRGEDLSRYQIKTQVWEVPFACDLEKFKVYNPSVDDFVSKLNEAVELSNLSPTGARELVKFSTEQNIVRKRCIAYVGRLSGEKNISILMDACEQLLKNEGMKEKIHFLFVGAGYAAAELEKRFGDNVTVTGLVPNYLLPDVYNFIRQRHGFFVSASDTETYGLTHEEATACGLPLVAMEKGTRCHFFCPGDRVGEFTIDRDDELANTINELAAYYRTKDFIIALNGLCIPDYSAGLGLSKLSTDYSGKDSAKKALLSAMYVMANLPVRGIAKMSQNASEFTVSSKLSWQETWQLLKKVYVNDLDSFNSIINPKKHNCLKTDLNAEMKDIYLQNNRYPDYVSRFDNCSKSAFL